MVYAEAVKSDLEQVAKIEQDVMSCPWSQENFLEALESDHTLFMVAKDGDAVAGYCLFYISKPEAELPDIVVARDYRRGGIGKMLLSTSFSMLKAVGVTDVFLEVRESNQPAIELYKSFGFENTGVRKGFYEKPVENAICMHGCI